MLRWKNTPIKELNTSNFINVHDFQKKFRALRTDINFILLDLRSHWLHDASIIWRLVCTDCLRDHSLVVGGSRAGIASADKSIKKHPRSSWWVGKNLVHASLLFWLFVCRLRHCLYSLANYLDGSGNPPDAGWLVGKLTVAIFDLLPPSFFIPVCSVVDQTRRCEMKKRFVRFPTF